MGVSFVYETTVFEGFVDAIPASRFVLMACSNISTLHASLNFQKMFPCYLVSYEVGMYRYIFNLNSWTEVRVDGQR